MDIIESLLQLEANLPETVAAWKASNMTAAQFAAQRYTVEDFHYDYLLRALNEAAGISPVLTIKGLSPVPEVAVNEALFSRKVKKEVPESEHDEADHMPHGFPGNSSRNVAAKMEFKKRKFKFKKGKTKI
jgi:hypothetical protein